MVTLCSELVCRGEDDNCCTTSDPCGEGEGDCDDDFDCQVGLICGNSNCKNKTGYQWDPTDDCCYNPSNYIFN